MPDEIDRRVRVLETVIARLEPEMERLATVPEAVASLQSDLRSWRDGLERLYDRRLNALEESHRELRADLRREQDERSKVAEQLHSRVSAVSRENVDTKIGLGRMAGYAAGALAIGTAAGGVIVGIGTMLLQWILQQM